MEKLAHEDRISKSTDVRSGLESSNGFNFRKVNNITGWVVFAIASLTYILTAEASGSFWDTGEFIASAYKLQLPHPPGAPLFVLIGRLFIVLFGDNPATAAKAVNVMSAFASSFTILFLFWTITHFARKLVVGSLDEPNRPQTWTIMAAGVVGGLAYTFSDSFWFSAVEGEVYALSSFFTALVFWAMLKWERADDLAGDNKLLKNRADRWIVFIFFMMGLSIGVHLLNLLTIPAIVMIYYYKRYRYNQKGAIMAFIIGCIITGIVQVAAIQYSIKIAGKFDIWFVNGFGLPFFSGFIFFFILLGVLVWAGLRWANKNHWSFLRLGLWCFTFLMLGYSTYVTTMVRSAANPAVDMNNVDNPMSLVYYLGREQYGSQPLFYGPHFQADYVDENGDGYIDFKEGEMKYTKGKDKYIEIGREQEPEYNSEDKQLFVRVWDRSNDQYHADFYADWLGLGRTQDPNTGQTKYEDPSYADNIQWFTTYQMGFMYWRYFMWNFAGKQNDVQGFGNKRDGNWIAGLPFIDNPRLGDQSMMPESLKNNKANNKLYMLPFILGILGCVYHFLSDRKDWIVSFLLFFFTGLAIVLYLNQPGNQPRERDYAFVGSFYAFAIWIGLAVVAIVQLARQTFKDYTFKTTLWGGAFAAFVITFLSGIYGSGIFLPSVMSGILYALFTVGAVYLVKAVSSQGNNLKMATITAFAVCMLAPVLMAQQEWNDHDRSRKTLAPDMARNYLESCAPNSIVFTFGDNDTYPLWYAQEVEGVRPDIRIINTSLLGIDWYINQLRYKVNESAPIDVIWTPEQIEGHKREYLRYQAAGQADKFYDLYDVMKNVLGQGDNVSSFPVKKFTVPVDTAYLRKSGGVTPADTLYPQMVFEIPEHRNDLTRSDLVIFNIIAATQWKRPIYFTSPIGELGFGQYLRKEGLAYRLVPVKNNFPQQNWLVDQTLRQQGLGGTAIRDNNTPVLYKALMETFRTGGAAKPGVYFDEENRRHLLTVRATYAEAAGNMSDLNQKAEAQKLLEKAEQMIDTNNLPYAMAGRYNSHNQTAMVYLEAAYKAGNKTLSEKLKSAINKDLQDQKRYYDYLRSERDDLYTSMQQEVMINDRMITVFETLVKSYEQKTPVVELPQSGTPNATAADSAQGQ